MSFRSSEPSYRPRTFWDDFDSLVVLPHPRRAVLALLFLMPVATGVAALCALWLGVEGTRQLAQVLPPGALAGRLLGLDMLPSWERLVTILLAAFPMIILARLSATFPALARRIGGAPDPDNPDIASPH